MPNSIPRLTASMSESPLYQVMGMGYTDRVFLLGHAEGVLNRPIPVSTMRDAVQELGADTNSPLLRGLLEAYYAGARDIWVVPVAPMSEYEPDLEARDTQYYQTYLARLEDTYEILKYWDIAQLVVPLDAPFNSSVDFLLPLVNYCIEAHSISSNVHLGLLGTRGPLTEELAAALSVDGRVPLLGDAGKFVSVFAGEVSFSMSELPVSHSGSPIAAIAGMLSRQPMNRGVVYEEIPNVLSTVGQDLDPEVVNMLAEAKINSVGRNVRGRRGAYFSIIPFTDNTLAADGSDYHSLAQMRLASAVANEVRNMGARALGTIGYDLFRSEVENYLTRLTADDFIRGFSLDIERDYYQPTDVYVDLVLRPYLGIRDIHVPVLVSPEER